MLSSPNTSTDNKNEGGRGTVPEYIDEQYQMSTDAVSCTSNQLTHNIPQPRGLEGAHKPSEINRSYRPDGGGSGRASERKWRSRMAS